MAPAAAEAVELLDERRGGGFRALKLRLGRADPRDDLCDPARGVAISAPFNAMPCWRLECCPLSAHRENLGCAEN
jgi:hypothetical protein